MTQASWSINPWNPSPSHRSYGLVPIGAIGPGASRVTEDCSPLVPGNNFPYRDFYSNYFYLNKNRQNPYRGSRVPGNFPYRDFDPFLIIGRAIVIEGNKFPIGIPVPGKQNFPCTRDPKIPGTREKKSPYSDTRFLKFWTSKIVILGQKTSKMSLFEKMLILGRRTFESRFFTKKIQAQKINIKIFILGEKA